MKTILWFFSKFDHKSAIALGVMIFIDFDMLMSWKHFWNANPTLLLRDPLSVALWLYMTILLCWNIDVRRDVSRILVGLLGGLLIESWGTFSEVWTYYTNERPPLWIIPAWPVAAISIDRMGRGIDKLLPKSKLKILWWLMIPPFIAYFTYFSYMHGNHMATAIAFATMIILIMIPGNSRQDVCLMIGGSLLGVVIEYYGTSRHIWTYYTHEIPPAVAVFAHGFASIGFQRGAGIVDKYMPTWQDVKNFRKPSVQ